MVKFFNFTTFCCIKCNRWSRQIWLCVVPPTPYSPFFLITWWVINWIVLEYTSKHFSTMAFFGVNIASESIMFTEYFLLEKHNWLWNCKQFKLKKEVVAIFEMFEIKIINKNLYAALILALPIRIRINCITACCSEVSWGLSNNGDMLFSKWTQGIWFHLFDS
jgi:hypothetical protein